VNLRNNPLSRGQATIHFGLSRADRVEVKVFDVSGRLVRTLADRQFGAGTHDLVWDGVDNVGRQVARGVYFTQVKYQNAKFAANRKLTVLK
jgi:flagellar hook assembly protein FlgD